jgi:hypothetical protein
VLVFKPFQQLYQALRTNNVKLCQALDTIGVNLQTVFTACNTNTIAVTTAIGPGAGTYTVGAKLTGGGNPGTITIDQYGRITAIQQAS